MQKSLYQLIATRLILGSSSTHEQSFQDFKLTFHAFSFQLQGLWQPSRPPTTNRRVTCVDQCQIPIIKMGNFHCMHQVRKDFSELNCTPF